MTRSSLKVKFEELAPAKYIEMLKAFEILHKQDGTNKTPNITTLKDSNEQDISGTTGVNGIRPSDS